MEEQRQSGWEQGAVEDIWTEEGLGDGRMDKLHNQNGGEEEHI
jgi:hypothetical protein